VLLGFKEITEKRGHVLSRLHEHEKRRFLGSLSRKGVL
jgi:hypothetical protein